MCFDFKDDKSYPVVAKILGIATGLNKKFVEQKERECVDGPEVCPFVQQIFLPPPPFQIPLDQLRAYFKTLDPNCAKSAQKVNMLCVMTAVGQRGNSVIQMSDAITAYDFQVDPENGRKKRFR